MDNTRLGDQLAEEKNWDEAVLAYQVGLKYDKTNKALRRKLAQAKSHAAESHFLKGKGYLAADQTPLAIEELRKAVVLNPTHQEYQNTLNEAMKIREPARH